MSARAAVIVAILAAAIACAANITEEIAASGTRTCARVGRTVECWGGSHTAPPGSQFTGSALPKALKMTDATEICVGRQFVCARREDGRVLCGSTLAGSELSIVGGVLRTHTLACGTAGGCAISIEGARCWDWNDEGVGTVALVPGLTNVSRVAVGRAHRCAVADDALWCWGDNSDGQLGVSALDTPSSTTPLRVENLGSPSSVASGGDHTCAVVGTGVHCFGANEVGQLGRSGGPSSSPSPVVALPEAAAVAAGLRHTCALLIDGSVRCWGWNRAGQVGDGTQNDQTSATIVPGIVDIVQLALGDEHSCALRDGGTALCWGRNVDGQLGDGTFDDRFQPTAVSRPN